MLGDIHVGDADAQRPGDVGRRPFLDYEQIKNLKLLEAEVPSKTLQLTADLRPPTTDNLFPVRIAPPPRLSAKHPV